MKLSSLSLTAMSFTFFLLANPVFFSGCASDSGDGFKYDEKDMLLVIEELNESKGLTFQSGRLALFTIDFQLEQMSGKAQAAFSSPGPTWLASAHACGDRTFIKEASACVSSSYLPVQGTLELSLDGELKHSVEVTGEMAVHSNLLRRAEFRLEYEGGVMNFTWDEESDSHFSPIEVSDSLALASDYTGVDTSMGGQAN